MLICAEVERKPNQEQGSFEMQTLYVKVLVAKWKKNINNFGLRGRCEQHEDLSRKTKRLEVA